MTAFEAALGAATDLLRDSVGPLGFAASTADAHYDALWTRDAAITCLGALHTGDASWHGAVSRTLTSVATRASAVGQLPNTVWSNGWWDFGEHAALDPTLWWCWAALRAQALDVALDAVVHRALPTALHWLRHRDAGGTGLIQQPVASDWMDSSVQRVGMTLHANALWCRIIADAQAQGIATGPGPDADELRGHLDLLLWPRADGDPADALGFLAPEVRVRGLPHPATVAAHAGGVDTDRDHWASHLRWGHLVDVVDVLGNSLAILAGVGTSAQHGLVLDGFVRRGVAEPFPSRTLGEPVEAGGADAMFDAAADENQHPRWRNPAWEYHNAASWPMVGGFHVLAARAVGRDKEADALADALAEACTEDGQFTFPEWRHGRTGAAGGARSQAWSAAAVLLAR
ncbi:MAG: hypothetical protein ACI867_001429 [Glaciecola sp.]|jgi:hypothetical protein